MLSIPHLIIIFVVALVVFGPEKLPELARNLGKVMAEFRRATGELRSTFEGHMKDLEREADSRRIGGATSAPEAQAPAEAVPISKPGVVSSLGNVPTLPPQSAAPLEGQEAAVGDSTAAESASSGPAESKAESIPETVSPETISDGGPRHA